MADYRHVGPAIVQQDRARFYAKNAMRWRDGGYKAMAVYYQQKAAEAHAEGFQHYLKFREETDGND